MSATLPTFSPRAKQPAGGCCGALAVPDLDHGAAAELAGVARALAEPVRLRIVDAIRKAAPKALCQSEITPLFSISRPAISRHLDVLVEASVVAVERRGLWAHHDVPGSSTLEVLDRARRDAAGAGMADAELVDGHVEVRDAHRVHAHASSAIVRARTP